MILVKVQIPATASAFYGFLLRVLALDLIDLDEDFDSWFGKTTQPLDGNFSMLGYESLYAMRNFGSLILIFPAILILLLLG